MARVMRRTVRRLLPLAALVLLTTACGVDDNDIERWKHTQRGPRKITTVLVQTTYQMPLRVHAARALIEMKHPNANGLELLQGALQSMPSAEREGIVHALIPELQRMMSTAPTTPAHGPSEAQIKSKDAAFVLLRGDGRNSFASAEDRGVLATMTLDWVLADFNTRALAGSFTAEQIVNVIGPTAADRLTRAITSSDESIPVVVELAKLINGVATAQGKQAAVAQIVVVAREVEAPAITDRLRAKARTLLHGSGRTITDDLVNSSAERLRDQYLTVLFESVRQLAQPNGAEYLLSVARNPAAPLARRKAGLTAMLGTVQPSHVPGLLEVLNCTPGPSCDVELRGLAIDRVGESRNREIVPQLYTFFGAANGGTTNQEFVLRWKLGEAILRLGGVATLADFSQRLSTPRTAPFLGYTYAELNGEAQAIGDMTPTPRDAMRNYLAPASSQPVRILAMLFLGLKGEQRDVATLQAMEGDTTAVAGLTEGWTEAQLATVGAVARRAREGLQNVLRAAQQAPSNPQ